MTPELNSKDDQKVTGQTSKGGGRRAWGVGGTKRSSIWLKKTRPGAYGGVTGQTGKVRPLMLLNCGAGEDS